MDKMIIKQLVDEDFLNYKKISMFIGFPRCDWKCEVECGKQICQNKDFTKINNIEIPIQNIVSRYLNNPLTSAIVFGGLEPFYDWPQLVEVIKAFREKTDDDIIIYTGYVKEEIKGLVEKLASKFPNIIVKYGRFVPDQEPHFDETLGVELSSPNQYAEKIN